jgi:SAM-dependent methyltransferase
LKYFDNRFAEDPKRGLVWFHLTKYLSQFIDRSGSVLEVGAGYCYFINAVEAKSKVALDIEADFVQYATNEVKTYVADATKLSEFSEGSFNTIFASNFLEHLSNDDANLFLENASRVLTDKGKLILIQPNFKYSYKSYFDDYTHLTIFTDVGLVDRLKSFGFTIEHVEKKFMPFTIKSRLSLFSFLIPLYLWSPWRPLAGQMLVVALK